MRVLAGVLCVLLGYGLLAYAADERPATIVGTVEGLDPDARAEITVHRLGGTELMERYGQTLDESVVRTLDTAADGRFEVAGLAPGVYVLVARQGATLIGDALVWVFAGSRREANVSLAPTRWLSGVVTWSDGRPVDGVARFRMRRYASRAGSGPYTVWQRAEPIPPPGPTFTATLTNGTFRIGLTARPTSISVETPDGLRIEGGEPWGPPDDEIRWTVAVPEKTVSGRVVDAVGAPVGGATIQAAYRAGEGPRLTTSTKSGEDGRFALRVVSVPAVIWASAERFGTLRVRDRAFEGGDLTFVRVPTAIVEGTVLLGGVPVAGAVVHAATGEPRGWPGGARRAVSGGDGRYRIAGVPVGLAAVFVRGGGFASVDLATVRHRGPNPFLVPLAAGEVATRHLPVESSAKLVVRVVDHEREPVVGATILALGVTEARGGEAGFLHDEAIRAHTGPFAAATDSDGRCRLTDLVPGHWLSMHIDAPGKPGLVAVARPEAGAAPTELSFARPRFLTVLVVDGDTEAPVPGASVFFDWHAEWHAERQQTGADGRARFGPFGDGRIQLRVRAETYVPAVGVDVKGSEDGAGPFALTVTLERGLTITGRVLDPDGVPLEGAFLSALHATQRRAGLEARTRSGAGGRFVLAGLFPGTWHIEVSDLARHPEQRHRRLRPSLRVEAEAGAQDVTFRFEAPPPRPVVVVRVTDPDGNPVPQARAQLVVRGRPTSLANVVDGQVRLVAAVDDSEWIEKGELFVRVTGAADADGRPLPLGAGGGGPVEADGQVLTVTLPPEQRIAGRVVSPEGEPVVGAMVYVHRPLRGPEERYDDWARDAGRTDAGGRFTVRYLGPGLYVVGVDAGTRFLCPLEEVEAGTQDVEIRLVRAVTARVVILGPDRQALPGVTFRVETSTRDRLARREAGRAAERRLPRPARRVVTTYESAADGSLVLQGLTPGRVYDVSVYSRRDDVQDATLVDWAPAPTEIRLERGIVIAGRVVDEDGQAVKDGIVAVEGPERWSGTRCGEDGSFRFTRLEPGSYKLHAGRRGMRWEDPRIRTQVVKEGVKDLVVEVAPR